MPRIIDIDFSVSDDWARHYGLHLPQTQRFPTPDERTFPQIINSLEKNGIPVREIAREATLRQDLASWKNKTATQPPLFSIK